MKKTSLFILTFALALVAVSILFEIDHANAATIESITNNTSMVEDKNILESPADLKNSTPTISNVEFLDTAEIDGLLFMREEEKLARDVYLTFYDRWNMNIFQNIASSENMHMNAILALMEQYGIDDPAADKGVGEFTDPDLQALYYKLITLGEQSLSDAIKVGSIVEEIDILDLEDQIVNTTKDDIIAVYENLAKGSRNHLRSFTKTLEQQTGEIYVPQYLSQETFESIIKSAFDSGSPNRENQG